MLLHELVPSVAEHCRGLVVGKRVQVLEGRNFATFSGGELGKLLSLDVDSQLCLVHFKGRPSPVEVPVRHLRGLGAPKEELSSPVTRSGRSGTQNVEAASRTPVANAEAAALKDMLALASPGSPRAAGTTATAGTAGTSTLPTVTSPEGAWFTLCECSPRSSFCTPWKQQETTDWNSQTGSTQASASPIDTVWREPPEPQPKPPPARAWRLPTSEPLPLGAVGTTLLRPAPEPLAAVAALPEPVAAPAIEPAVAGLLPPGNLLGSISSLPTVPFSSPPSVNVRCSVSPFGTF